MIMPKKMKRFLGGFCILVCILALPAFLPLRMTLRSTDQIRNEHYFIVEMISRGTTDGGRWVCIGDETTPAFEDVWYAVELDGSSPEAVLSTDVYDVGGTTFVIYGTTDSGMKVDSINRIHCTGWALLGDITRDPETLRLPLKKYITLYDLKYFDFLFKSPELYQ